MFNPFHYLGEVWGAAAGAVGDVWSKGKRALSFLLHLVTEVFWLVGGAWDWMVRGVGWLGDNLVGAAARVLHLLEWLALHVVPEGLAWAWKHAYSLALAALHTVEHAVTLAWKAAFGWLRGVVNTLASWARAAVRYVAKIAGEAWSFVENVGKRVADLVLHPERLARWILGALVLPLVRWFIESSAWVLLWLFRAFVRESAAFAHTLEDVLTRVL